MSQSPHHILKHTFGYDHFRAHQQAIVETVSAGEDALVLMPTGAGKSLCYQIPALARNGCGIVVSPLIALMQNQVDALRELGVRAAYLNSTLPLETAQAVESKLINGDLDFLYIAPERLIQPRTVQMLQRAQLALFAIDEAHCVSQWGHDFRADYLQLSLLASEFPQVPRIALTATADQRTREEIIHRLSLQNAKQFVSGFDRPNICYRISVKYNARQQLLNFVKTEHPEDSGIVYCLSRKKVEDTAAWLQQEGFSALPYHAGLDAGLRRHHQERFLREEGIIVVATIAFGMGIDKPDVRFVAHLDLPKNLESYYQETGRAGRDGEPANAWMAYGLQDIIKLRQMMQNSEGSMEHKLAEQHRLSAMLGLCEITSCRRQALLNYFGDQLSEPCGNCDTCLEPPSTWDGTEAARKALSTVYRCGQRFGVNHIIDVLRGSDNDRVQQLKHNTLSTFGIGGELDTNQWRSVFRQLVARGYLSVDFSGFGALKLEEKCRPLLRGEEMLDLRLDVRKKAQRQTTRTPLPGDIDVELWEALRERRRELADEQDVPPYVVFSNQTLQEMCIRLPTTLQQMSHVNGVGERKLKKYGDEFIRIIAAHTP